MATHLRRSETVCDFRPSVEQHENESTITTNSSKTLPKRKKGIFGKIFRSFAKLGKKKQFQSTSNLEILKFASVAGSDSGVGSSAYYAHHVPGTSFGDAPRDHQHGSDSASTGYVSEGSSRRTANPGVFGVDLEKENKLAKRAHARFRSDDSENSDANHRLVTRSNINVFTLRSSDTDLDRDETDLNTDEERDSSVYTDEDSQGESYSDSFYSSESSSTTSDDDHSQKRRNYDKKRSKDSSPVRQSSRVKTSNPPKRSRTALPSVQHTVSTSVLQGDINVRDSARDFKPSPSAPSPALRARILRLEMGDVISTFDEKLKHSKSNAPVSILEKSEISRNSAGGVKNIAARFKAKSEMRIDTETDERSGEETPVNIFGRSKSVMSPSMVASGLGSRKRNSVLEKFAPKLELEPISVSDSDKKDSQPISLRRTQSTKVLDLAASLFRPGEDISTEPANHEPVRNKPVGRSQTMKQTSPKSMVRRQSQDSFIRELLEIAKSESTEEKEPKKLNDFKSQISMASKIVRRKTITSADDPGMKAVPLPKTRAHSVQMGVGLKPIKPKSTDQNLTTELDPFVEDILQNKTVPLAVKQKIREECWSLFNDPKTPKGVKQCILNTMMTKSQTE